MKSNQLQRFFKPLNEFLGTLKFRPWDNVDEFQVAVPLHDPRQVNISSPFSTRSSKEGHSFLYIEPMCIDQHRINLVQKKGVRIEHLQENDDAEYPHDDFLE